MISAKKTVLILGANSDVAREMVRLYSEAGYLVIAASRSIEDLNRFILENKLDGSVEVCYFDAVAFETHHDFYYSLKAKPSIIVYAAGFLKANEEALGDWDGTFQMMKVHYCGAV